MKHYASNQRLSIQEQQGLYELLQLGQLKEFIQAKYKKLVTIKDSYSEFETTD